jgi:hypothetical protein
MFVQTLVLALQQTCPAGQLAGLFHYNLRTCPPPTIIENVGISIPGFLNQRLALRQIRVIGLDGCGHKSSNVASVPPGFLASSAVGSALARESAARNARRISSYSNITRSVECPANLFVARMAATIASVFSSMMIVLLCVVHKYLAPLIAGETRRDARNTTL